ncbi:MAG: SDR family oxidoreductase [Deferribacterota bacterium]|nr:SDR family oxidoreductase [Deferribacterota bacterium]
MRLKNKVALITGGSRGIGRAIAQAYSSEGAKLYIVAHKDKKMLDETIDVIQKEGGEAYGGLFDVSLESDVVSLFNDLSDKLGDLDIVVNNAGIIKPKSFIDTTFKDWKKTINVHLDGTFLCTYYAVKNFMLNKNEGKIINLVAPAAFRGLLSVVDYASAKGGIASFTKNVAKELVSNNIQVNAVSPVAETRMTEDLYEFYKAQFGPNYLDFLEKPSPPQAVAPLFVFLASKESDYITGQIIAADGGVI